MDVGDRAVYRCQVFLYPFYQRCYRGYWPLGLHDTLWMSPRGAFYSLFHMAERDEVLPGRNINEGQELE